MALVVKVGEAKTRLSELLHRVEAGEEVILSRGPVAIARLAPFEAGGRRAAAFADLLDARESCAAAPATAAELGLWREPTASSPARPPHVALDRPIADDGPAAPPGVGNSVPPADIGRGLVVDPSFAAAWLLPGPDRRVADAAAAFLARCPARATALVPPGFWIAFGDLLLAAGRAGRISDSAAAAQFARAGRLPLVETTLADGLDRDSDGEARAAIMRLASANGLSFAGGACLGFARARSLPLASNSPALARAASRLGVPLLTDLRDADLA